MLYLRKSPRTVMWTLPKQGQITHFLPVFGFLMTDNSFVSHYLASNSQTLSMTNQTSDKRIKLNVGGVIFETLASTLSRQPGTRLAQLAHLQELDEAWNVETQEYFFDRHPGVFIAILHFYRTEELHTDHNICGNVINAVSKNFIIF